MPDKIGRYEITDELGKGAMGIVYKATDPNIGRTVALKTMRLDMLGADMQQMISRFKNEARATGVLNHPNIVTIFDAGEDHGIFYIAMAYIEGKTLAAVLNEKHVLTVDEVINFGSQMCAGLDYAHRNKIVHRDVKPANMIIDANGTLHIMDFGIAKLEAGLTRTGEILGTPNYMSPEQVKGRTLDGRSDLFSVGVILYEMITGERPFNGSSVTTIIYKVVHEIPIPPRELDATIHPGLSAIVTKALAKSPEDRYQTGAELAEALRNYKTAALVPDPSVEMATRVMTESTLAPASTQAPMPGTPTTKIAQTALNKGSGTATQTATRVISDTTAPFEPSTNLQSGPVSSPQKSHFTAVMLGALSAVLLAGAGIGLWIKNSKPPIRPAQEQAVPAQTPTVPVVATASQNTAPVNVEPAPPPSSPVVLAASSKTPVESFGRIRISSDPPGARVEVDGKLQPSSVTPLNSLPLKPGTHIVKVSLDGYSPATQSVAVAVNKKADASFQLVPLAATYNITSTPPGAGIIVDGVPSGQRTPARLSLSPGQHKIVVHLEGYRNFEIAGDAGAGQTLDLSPVMFEKANQPARAAATLSANPPSNLSPEQLAQIRRFYDAGQIPAGMGAIQARTRPQGVTVIVDGHARPRITPLKFLIAPGMHNVTLQKDGFRSVTKTVLVTEGRETEIDERLPPK